MRTMGDWELLQDYVPVCRGERRFPEMQIAGRAFLARRLGLISARVQPPGSNVVRPVFGRLCDAECVATPPPGTNCRRPDCARVCHG